MVSFPLRPEVTAFTPYSPGLSIEEIQAKYNLASVIKMASNENPLGTSPLVQKRIQDKAAFAFRYTQSGTPRLLKALASHLGVPEENIVLGNGSDEVIDLLVRCCPTAGKHNVVASRPSFSLYELQSRLCGVTFSTVPLNPDSSFNWQGLRDTVNEQTAMVFITTPDNPSGYCPPVEEVRAFAKSLPPSCLLVVDEAYIDFCDKQEDHSLFNEWQNYPNLVLLRTFSKSYGLAGLRLGYGIMPAHLARILCSVRPPFSVNILAEEAGITALEDNVFYEKTLETVKTGRCFLRDELQKIGCAVAPTQANFLMFTLPQASTLSAQDVFEALLAKGIIIRPLRSYGLPNSLRVSVGTPEENQIFITALRDVLAS